MIRWLPVPEVEKIMQEARDSIGNYCMNICRGKCCLGGMLIAKNENEVRVWLKISKNITLEEYALLNPYRLEKHNSFYVVHFPCRQFDNGRCSIHEDPGRPYQCKVYPIQMKMFRINNEIMNTVEYTTECDAVKAGLLDSYIERIVGLGYNIESFPKKRTQ